MNAFSSILIHGLVKINDIDVPLTCSRGISKPTKTIIDKTEYYITVDGPPVRPPSKLPPPGDLCLNVSLNPERLGHGRIGSVYSIRVDDLPQSSLPPLVIKVSARHRSEKLAREAWFYEEMEHLQGSSIPLCYGFFTAEIKPNTEIMNWEESDENYRSDEIDGTEDENVDGEGEGWGESEDIYKSPESVSPNTMVWNEHETSHILVTSPACGTNSTLNNHTPEDEDTKDQSSGIRSNHSNIPPTSNGDDTTFISVLVLERLGDLMPICVSLEHIRFVLVLCLRDHIKQTFLIQPRCL